MIWGEGCVVKGGRVIMVFFFPAEGRAEEENKESEDKNWTLFLGFASRITLE